MRIAKKKLLNNIENSFGNITLIAGRLNCSRQAIYDAINRDEKIAQKIKDEREKIIDLAENKLITNINNGVTASIHLVLTTLGKDRGYVSKTEIENRNLGVQVIEDDIK